jgi:hypothetical protein
MSRGEAVEYGNGETRYRDGKARVSPELQELMHMLSSLENQFSSPPEDE